MEMDRLTPFEDGEPRLGPGAIERLVRELAALRRRYEERTVELRESEARFRDVIEAHSDALVIVDRDGNIRYANAMAGRLFGRDPADLFGAPFGLPIVVDETTEVELRTDPPRTAEMRVVISEWEGKPACLASLRDITERKQAERDALELAREQSARAAAEAAANRMEFLLESTTVLASTLNYPDALSAVARLCTPALADWTVVYAVDDMGHLRRHDVTHRDPSKAALARELLGMPVDPDGINPVMELLERRQSRLVPRMTDEMMRGLSADPREIEVARSLGIESMIQVPMIARGRPLGAISLVSASPIRRFTETDLQLAEDVAARAALAADNARLFEEAQRANQTKSDFLAVVSHDLRTPLTAIIGYADLLDMGIPDPLTDGCRDRVGRIRTSAHHLMYLLDELLAFARLEAGREEVRCRGCDVREVVLEVASVVEPLVLERGLELRMELPERPVPMNTDPDKVRQILLNLVGNGVKYTAKGHVTVAVIPATDGVTIRVQDTGEGIAAAHLDRIFEPFWQVDGTRRQREGGTGLGLSVVRRLARMLGGDVVVRSEPGRGSTFTVRLPDRAA